MRHERQNRKDRFGYAEDRAYPSGDTAKSKQNRRNTETDRHADDRAY